MIVNILCKNSLSVRILVFLMLLSALTILSPRQVQASIANEKVLEIQPVTDGLVMEKREVVIDGKKVLVYILKADLKNNYLKIDTLLGSGNSLDKNTSVTNMAINSGAVAAVNADFFQMSESGRPIGMAYKDGQMVTSPPMRSDMLGWAITKDGVPLIQIFNFQGSVKSPNGMIFPISGVNKPSYFQAGGKTSHENTILMYNHFWGKVSRGKINDKDDVVEVFVSNGIVTDVVWDSPGRQIPTNGYVLAGRGSGAVYIKENIRVGDPLSLNYSVTPEGDNIKTGTGGWSLMVDNGQPLTSFPSDINGINARTAVGYSGNKGTFYVVVVEKSSVSRGMNLNELAAYMAAMGIERALNLDGGGSTTLAARPLGDEKAVLVNRPSAGTQRSIPTGLGFFSTAPPGKLSGLVISSPGQVFPGDNVSVKVKGYDSHYNPYPITAGKSVITVEAGPGSVTDGSFVASSPGMTTISAYLDGFRATKTIRTLGAGDLKRIQVNPSSINIEPGQSAEFKVIAVDNNNTEYLLSPNNYSYTMIPGLGSIKGEIFEASQTPGAGKITFSLGDYSVSVPVRVSVSGESFVDYSPGNAVNLIFDEMTLKLPANAFGDSVKITARSGEYLEKLPSKGKMIYIVDLEASVVAAKLRETAELSWKVNKDLSGKLKVYQLLDSEWKQISSVYNEQKGIVTADITEITPIALIEDMESGINFVDMKGHWSAAPVSRLAAAGIVSGYPGNRFEPDGKIKRSEFIVLLSKVMGWQPIEGAGNFKDSKNIPGWSIGYVLSAFERGVVSGYEDNTFRPDKNITREEMAVMICSAMSLPASDNIKAAQVFVDGSKISHWAQSQVSAALAAGVMKGDNDKSFRPKENATRAESAAMFDSVINKLNN